MTETIEFEKWMDEFIKSLANNLGLKKEDLEVPFSGSCTYTYKFSKPTTNPVDPRSEK